MVLHYDQGKYGHPREWILLDRKRKKVLKIFGGSKPSYERVLAEERRIQKFKYRTSISVRANNPGSLKKRKSHNRKVFMYATIKRGTVKVTSKKQLRLIYGRKLPHTNVYRQDGKIIKERVRI